MKAKKKIENEQEKISKKYNTNFKKTFNKKIKLLKIVKNFMLNYIVTIHSKLR